MCLHLQLILSGCLKFGRFLLFLSSYICNSHFSIFYFCLVIVLSPASSMNGLEAHLILQNVMLATNGQ